MSDRLYTESAEYQKEIAEQYKKRVAIFDLAEIAKSLGTLGFSVESKKLETIAAGNMNSTYLTADIVIKVSKSKDSPSFYSNKIVSDRLMGKSLVVEVLAYDFFEKTPFEILVMKRAPGVPLLDDILELSESETKDLFRQVLGVVKEMATVEFEFFGWLNQEGKESHPSFAEFLKYEFKRNAQKIRDEKLCQRGDLEKVELYFLNHVGIFDTEKHATIMHRDLHMGNFLHEGGNITALIDFDWSMRGPKMGNLKSLLSFIDTPSQFTEGSAYYEKFKGRNFHFLLPVLREKFGEVFEDRDLVQKLNLLFISDGIKWIAENWSQRWNEETMKNILTTELVEGADILGTYPGKVLSL